MIQLQINYLQILSQDIQKYNIFFQLGSDKQQLEISKEKENQIQTITFENPDLENSPELQISALESEQSFIQVSHLIKAINLEENKENLCEKIVFNHNEKDLISFLVQQGSEVQSQHEFGSIQELENYSKAYVEQLNQRASTHFISNNSQISYLDDVTDLSKQFIQDLNINALSLVEQQEEKQNEPQAIVMSIPDKPKPQQNQEQEGIVVSIPISIPDKPKEVQDNQDELQLENNENIQENHENVQENSENIQDNHENVQEGSEPIQENNENEQKAPKKPKSQGDEFDQNAEKVGNFFSNSFNSLLKRSQTSYSLFQQKQKAQKEEEQQQKEEEQNAQQNQKKNQKHLTNKTPIEGKSLKRAPQKIHKRTPNQTKKHIETKPKSNEPKQPKPEITSPKMKEGDPNTPSKKPWDDSVKNDAFITKPVDKRELYKKIKYPKHIKTQTSVLNSQKIKSQSTNQPLYESVQLSSNQKRILELELELEREKQIQEALLKKRELEDNLTKLNREIEKMRKSDLKKEKDLENSRFHSPEKHREETKENEERDQSSERLPKINPTHQDRYYDLQKDKNTFDVLKRKKYQIDMHDKYNSKKYNSIFTSKVIQEDLHQRNLTTVSKEKKKLLYQKRMKYSKDVSIKHIPKIDPQKISLRMYSSNIPPQIYFQYQQELKEREKEKLQKEKEKQQQIQEKQQHFKDQQEQSINLSSNRSLLDQKNHQQIFTQQDEIQQPKQKNFTDLYSPQAAASLAEIEQNQNYNTPPQNPMQNQNPQKVEQNYIKKVEVPEERGQHQSNSSSPSKSKKFEIQNFKHKPGYYDEKQRAWRVHNKLFLNHESYNSKIGNMYNF